MAISKNGFVFWIFLIQILLLVLFETSCKPINSPTTDSSDKAEVYKNGMIVTAHPIATEVGLEILKNGGNAFDAAVAVQFALAVVYPRAGNIGGGGFAVLYLNNGKVTTLDFREKAPINAKRDMYLNAQSDLDGNKSTMGIFSVGVPGTVAGMEEMHRKYGKLPWSYVMGPAIQLALKGVQLTAGEAGILNAYKDVIAENNGNETPFFSSKEFVEGDSIRYTELGETLFRIGEKGAQEFYRGLVANRIIAESKKRNGILTKEDLMNYEPIWREPISAQINEFTVYSMAPPSSGGLALIQLLKGAQQVSLSQYSHNSVLAIHYMAELQRRVFVDRAIYLGDPDFVEIPQEMLISDTYLKNKFSDINAHLATPSSTLNAGEVEVIESHETTHFSIVDQWGNAVSITTTLNGNFGSKVLVSGAGFFLNNEMDDFSAKPGVPNQFGLIGGEANAIQPQKRMLSSMAPTIITKNNKLWMVVGTPGGSTIINTTYQTIQNVMSYGMTMTQAVNATKIHSQWLPDEVYVENQRLDSMTLDSLRKMGHVIQFWDRIGNMNAILVSEEGIFEGAPDDTRGENTAKGF